MPVPPRLRDAHECGDCKYYSGPQEGRGRCEMYSYDVGEDEVCDSWVAGEPQDQARRLWAKHRRRLREAN